jgi:hypothetical protein
MAHNEQTEANLSWIPPKERCLKEVFWRRVIGEQRHSELTQSDFCRRHGIVPARYFWWKRRLALRERADESSATEAPPANHRHQPASLVAVRIRPSPLVGCDGLKESGFEIALADGRVIKVPQQFDGQALERLLGILER